MFKYVILAMLMVTPAFADDFDSKDKDIQKAHDICFGHKDTYATMGSYTTHTEGGWFSNGGDTVVTHPLWYLSNSYAAGWEECTVVDRIYTENTKEREKREHDFVAKAIEGK